VAVSLLLKTANYVARDDWLKSLLQDQKMNPQDQDKLKESLLARRQELNERLARIGQNLRRGLEADSAERAKQLEDRDVVDALGNDARDELRKIALTLERIDSGDYGTCTSCGTAVGAGRLAAYPYASRCIDCAQDDSRRAF
jgi:RNA polymerase-binding protein DksA